MKVLQFMASSGYGGAEKVFVELSNALAGQHQVTALLLRDCGFRHRFTADHLTIAELRSNPTSNNPLLHVELFRLLRRLQPDIIHTHAAKGAMLVNRVNRFLQIPHLATKHNDRKGSIFNKLMWVSAVSQKASSSVLAKRGAEVRTIYNGLVETEVTPGSANAVFTMLAVGRLDAIKGFDLLIRQVAALDFPFRLRIIGEGPEEVRLAALIAELGLEGRVQLAGYQEDIPQLMHDADLVIISSHREGGPKVMAEALFYAPLLLATPVGAVPELLPEDLQTSHETLGADIRRLHGDYERYAGIFRQVAEKRKENFTFTRIVASYENYYADILRAKR